MINLIVCLIVGCILGCILGWLMKSHHTAILLRESREFILYQDDLINKHINTLKKATKIIEYAEEQVASSVVVSERVHGSK